MPADTLNFGPAGGFRFSRNSGRSITGEALGAIRYPSPFFDIAHTYLPTSFKSMLRWCRYYFLTNPLINATVYKMASYPVTDLIFDAENESLRRRWTDFFQATLNWKKFEVEAGLDYHCYGNCFISIHYPFRKLLGCKSCGHYNRVRDQKYIFREYKFIGNCRKCGHYGEFKVRDHYIRSMRDIRLIRWNPEYITVQHNEATGENRYYYTIPPTLANDVRMSKRHVIENVPQVFIEALRKNKALLFSPQNIYHMQRPTIAQKDRGWGMPMILPVLKDTFYLQILRKAQEAIAIEHIVPMRVLFPQTASGTADVYATVNMTQWREKIEQEIIRWRLDNNYIPIMPVPVGQATLGGDGRALMLSQEYRQWSEHIVAGMGVPIEFVFGGMQYSGSNVSMRILENYFLDQRTQSKQIVTDFVLPNVGAFMGWPVVGCHYKRFKMADDLQRSAFYMQLNQSGKISDKALLEDSDWDSVREQERIAEEQKRILEGQRRQAVTQAAIQGEAQLIMAKYQMRGQKLMNELAPEMAAGGMPGAEPMPGAGIPGMASPMAEGQMMNQEVGMMNAAGQVPGMEIPPTGPEVPAGGANPMAGPMPGAEQAAPAQPGPMEAAESPINADQQGAAYQIQVIAQRVVTWLNQLPDHEKQQELMTLRQNNPQLYAMVLPMLQQSMGAEQNSAAMPQPEERPARRGPEAQAV
jgi:hypothetical protein